MTLPTKGSRRIVVDGIPYRWMIRHKPTYSQAITNENLLAAVELFESPASTLSIKFPWVRYDAYFGIAKEPVTPSLIEACIRNALEDGWQPNKSGPAYCYIHENYHYT